MSETDNPGFQRGRDDVPTAIILSAPGRLEEQAGRPAAGQTGQTLNALLAELSQRRPEIAPSADKDDYRIVNAVAHVHYKGSTGRTEPTKREIADANNRERLKRLLSDKPNLIALGKKAQYAVGVADREATLKGRHPSMSSLNAFYKAHAESPPERAAIRVVMYAVDVAASDSAST